MTQQVRDPFGHALGVKADGAVGGGKVRVNERELPAERCKDQRRRDQPRPDLQAEPIGQPRDPIHAPDQAEKGAEAKQPRDQGHRLGRRRPGKAKTARRANRDQGGGGECVEGSRDKLKPVLRVGPRPGMHGRFRGGRSCGLGHGRRTLSASRRPLGHSSHLCTRQMAPVISGC